METLDDPAPSFLRHSSLSFDNAVIAYNCITTGIVEFSCLVADVRKTAQILNRTAATTFQSLLRVAKNLSTHLIFAPTPLDGLRL